jgi:hypothetical protein
MAGNNIQIRLPDGAQLALPEWMLDEQACQDIRESDSSYIAIPALTHLRRLLSAQPLLQRAHGNVVGGSLPPQDAHAQNQTATTSPVSTGGTRNEPAAGGAGAMHRSSQSDSPGGGAKKIANKRGGKQ